MNQVCRGSSVLCGDPVSSVGSRVWTWDQMSEVRTHFQDQGYTISREANTGATTGSHSSATGDVFKWSISWE